MCVHCVNMGEGPFHVLKNVMPGVYSKGDFMVHLAGLNDKKTWIKKILRDIEEEEKMARKKEKKLTRTINDKLTS